VESRAIGIILRRWLSTDINGADEEKIGPAGIRVLTASSAGLTKVVKRQPEPKHQSADEQNKQQQEGHRPETHYWPVRTRCLATSDSRLRCAVRILFHASILSHPGHVGEQQVRPQPRRRMKCRIGGATDRTTQQQLVPPRIASFTPCNRSENAENMGIVARLSAALSVCLVRCRGKLAVQRSRDQAASAAKD
jgi:hypothetical protein